MAQSAADSRKSPLQIDAFWEKPTITPPLSWDKWTQQWKLALLVKEGIQLETLINGPPSAIPYPTEPTYEEPEENHTQATERHQEVRNQPLKVNWQNRRKKFLWGQTLGTLRTESRVTTLPLHRNRRPSHFKEQTPSFPNRETALQGPLASDVRFVHQNSEYYLRSFRFFFLQTTKR